MKRALLVPILLSVIALASCSGTAFVYVANEHYPLTELDPVVYDPTISVNVNGETKTVSHGYDEEWVIDWFGFKFREDVTVRATIISPAMSYGGLFEYDFQVGDDDVKDITVYLCSGYQE